ncbi:hypothetical protein B0J13DRAFT_587607 [Dactylonectria estremocensis]|uniref:DUF2293 domain-containing protein n=1 Tax=Dactylonectria estremocensis TaxID=1079267 RepID=A0A9P9EB77_9HYPO|nr:hypothetical protein B0J13DRAFT_587607 [Dactylonectria estremocensis]
MGRERRNLPAAVAGGPKERHKRAQRSQYDRKAPVPQGFVAKPAIPKTKYHSYFEFVENKDKKKKLEYQITTRKTPPPGFEFVPIGNPELTTACKELSRDKDAMIFIVSNSKEVDSSHLAHQVHRIGHHIREIIVDEARATIGQIVDYVAPASGQAPEPIPESQEEYDAQVDAAIRDLFPRVPNTDRQMIIEHSFRRGTTFKGDKPVGLSDDITLARRVQLAVLAHIRHTHTRYDTLLKETTWQNARKVVEGLCLDTLVKWRGDEETGRDQLDEILREVVVISDSEDEDFGQDTDESSVEEIEPPLTAAVLTRVESNASGQAGLSRLRSPRTTVNHTGPLTRAKSKGKAGKANRKNLSDKKGQRGFKRYHAWQEAIRRYREEQEPEPRLSPMGITPNYAPRRQLILGPAAPYTPHEFPDPSELRITSKDAGPVPTENGYVVQQPSYSGQSMKPARHSYSPRPRPPMHDKVMSPQTHPSGQSPHQPVSRVNTHLQDMLVRSIEPASPESMRPSFIRTVPSRSQGFGNGSPARSSMQYSPRGPSPLRGVIVRDEPIFPRRRLMRDQPLLGAKPLAGYHDDHRGQMPNVSHEQRHVPTCGGFAVSNSPLYRSDVGPLESDQPPTLVPSWRPFENVPRPGETSSPVLMADRGGFFERVATHPDGAHPLPRATEIIEYRQPTNEVQRAPEPHRVVSWHEGSRILRGGQGSARVEVIPIASAPFGRAPRTVLADPAVIEQRAPAHRALGQVVDDGRYPIYPGRTRFEPRPVSGSHFVPRQEVYREVRHHEPLPVAPQHFEPTHQHTRNELPTIHDQYNSRRVHSLHPHRPEDVIVLE